MQDRQNTWDRQYTGWLQLRGESKGTAALACGILRNRRLAWCNLKCGGYGGAQEEEKEEGEDTDDDDDDDEVGTSGAEEVRRFRDHFSARNHLTVAAASAPAPHTTLVNLRLSQHWNDNGAHGLRRHV